MSLVSIQNIISIVFRKINNDINSINYFKLLYIIRITLQILF